MIQNVKENINKIDSDLKQLFENVYITEKANKTFYFQINANNLFLFENCKKRVQVIVNINKSDLNSNLIKWNYLVNPLNESSEKIDRVSNINNIANDIFDIANNKRMIKEYFNNLEEQYDLILENSNYEETIFDIISKYGIIKNKLEDKNKINIVLEKSIKMSDRFLLEKELNNKISYISFNDNNLNIQKL